MNNFVIYSNLQKDKNLEVTQKICSYLSAHSCRSLVWERGERESETKIRQNFDDGCGIEQAQCMIVLGGDGTMLRAASDMKDHQIPMIGVNLGMMGYLAEIELDNLTQMLDRLMDDRYEVESRMMLKGGLIHNISDGGGDLSEENWALNDIVLSRNGPLKVVRFRVFVNEQFLYEYDADGVIVTSPTGSTGYNLSAGGPIVEPQARVIVITPVCPHSLIQRSIILSSVDRVEIEVSEGKEGQEQILDVSFDGDNTCKLRTGERIRVVCGERTARIIKINGDNFLENLRRKMSGN